MTHDLREITDARPLATTFIPSEHPHVADTLVILPAGGEVRTASPVVVPVNRGFPNQELVRFRDEVAIPPWWRMRPNLPTDPAPARPEHADPTLCTVPIRIVTPDTRTARGAIVMKNVHPEMVGDYLRAGWNRA